MRRVSRAQRGHERRRRARLAHGHGMDPDAPAPRRRAAVRTEALAEVGEIAGLPAAAPCQARAGRRAGQPEQRAVARRAHHAAAIRPSRTRATSAADGRRPGPPRFTARSRAAGQPGEPGLRGHVDADRGTAERHREMREPGVDADHRAARRASRAAASGRPMSRRGDGARARQRRGARLRALRGATRREDDREPSRASRRRARSSAAVGPALVGAAGGVQRTT